MNSRNCFDCRYFDNGMCLLVDMVVNDPQEECIEFERKSDE